MQREREPVICGACLQVEAENRSLQQQVKQLQARDIQQAKQLQTSRQRIADLEHELVCQMPTMYACYPA